MLLSEELEGEPVVDELVALVPEEWVEEDDEVAVDDDEEEEEEVEFVFVLVPEERFAVPPEPGSPKPVERVSTGSRCNGK